MKKTIFDEMGGTYTQVGDYMLPDLLPAEEEKEANIGVWAMRHKRYLKQNHKVLYYNLLTSGKLNSYLVDIEQHAQDLFLRLVKDLAVLMIGTMNSEKLTEYSTLHTIKYQFLHTIIFYFELKMYWE